MEPDETKFVAEGSVTIEKMVMKYSVDHTQELGDDRVTIILTDEVADDDGEFSPRTITVQCNDNELSATLALIFHDSDEDDFAQMCYDICGPLWDEQEMRPIP